MFISQKQFSLYLSPFLDSLISPVNNTHSYSSPKQQFILETLHNNGDKEVSKKLRRKELC